VSVNRDLHWDKPTSLKCSSEFRWWRPSIRNQWPQLTRTIGRYLTVLKHESTQHARRRDHSTYRRKAISWLGSAHYEYLWTLNLTNKILRTQAYDLCCYSSWNVLGRNHTIEYSAARMLVPRIKRLRSDRRFSSLYLAGPWYGSGD